MLPRGASADLAGFSIQQALKSMHPDVQTAARLLVGRCSCDFVRERSSDQHEDERHLRERYRQAGVPRARIIPALERHRRGTGIRAPSQGWFTALGTFVAEHARNAGPSLYYLHFSAEEGDIGPAPIQPVPIGRVVAEPRRWLTEGTPALVAR